MINRYVVILKSGCSLKYFSTLQSATDSLDWHSLKLGSNDTNFIVDLKDDVVYNAKWCYALNAIELITTHNKA